MYLCAAFICILVQQSIPYRIEAKNIYIYKHHDVKKHVMMHTLLNLLFKYSSDVLSASSFGIGVSSFLCKKKNYR